ncbi:hypothetical protein B0H13DRAFT_1946486, partial [Mycena leptocephala]
NWGGTGPISTVQSFPNSLLLALLVGFLFASRKSSRRCKKEPSRGNFPNRSTCTSCLQKCSYLCAYLHSLVVLLLGRS